MKILMVAPQPFFEARGTPISVSQRLEGLSKLGYSIDLVTYPIGADIILPGVKIIRAPRFPFIKKLKVGPSWPKAFLDLMLIYKTMDLLIKNKYDVIHSHEEAAFFCIILASLFRTKHMYDMHSSLPMQLKNFNFGNNRFLVGIFNLLERAVISSCDAVITIGPDLEEHVTNIRPDALEVMIENLPLKANSDPDDKRYIGKLRERLGVDHKIAIVYTGTFERYQGVDLLIESFKHVQEIYPQIALILVGGQEYQIQEYKRIARDMQIENCIHFIGKVSLEDAGTYLELADILVSPRVGGTSVPLKIYTYMYAGKPIVATDLTAHTNVLDRDTAVLVEPTAERFAAGILKLIQDKKYRLALGDNARKRAEELYNASSYLSKLEWIYKQLTPSTFVQEQRVGLTEK